MGAEEDRLGLHTDLIEGAPGAPPHEAVPLAVQRRFPYSEGARTLRRVQNRGLLWVRITLLIVVSALLLRVVGSSRARHTPDGHPAFPSHPASP